MEDFPLNPWQWAKMPIELRNHTLHFVKSHGYFKSNGSPEDFRLFCTQVETNAQTLNDQKQERHRQWVAQNPVRHQAQEDLRNARGRGRARGP